MSAVKRMSCGTMMGLMAVLTLAYLFGVFVLAHIHDLSSGGRLLLELGMSTGFMVALLGICILWWRGQDEAQQEAQKWAWYWGATFGLPALAPIVFVLIADHGALLSALLAWAGAPGSPIVAMLVGILATLVPMCFGAVVAWVVWWSRRR